MAGDADESKLNVPSSDARLEALKSFKDWSNYLLVTTVAAVGWVGKQNTHPALVASLAIWSLGISAVFGVFTLALVPLVSEQMDRASDRPSIFTVPVQFYVGGPTLRTMHLTQACRPQHLSFMLGVLLYSAAATGLRGPRLEVLNPWSVYGSFAALVVVFAWIARGSHRRSPEPKPK